MDNKINIEEIYNHWITTFNINARYDSYRQTFYKKCTPDFTSEWISKTKELREWIKVKL